MGLYDVLKQNWTDPEHGTMPLTRKITAGLIAGGIGAAVGNPADVAMVRMQADVGFVRPIQGDDCGERVDEGRAWDPRCGEFAAGFVAAVASNPVDVIKTRVMNMKVEAGETPPYNGALDCALKTVRAEGPLALYKGFIPTISRQGPFTVVLFVTLEQVRKLLKDF
ncbi:Mitochondrial substrate/solute carrier [Sesbania bispinosa]|nr:Mitochondrial substrate/solute carrier [Sesbania bispinosa]